MPLSGLKKETREPAIWAKEPAACRCHWMKLTKLTCLSPPSEKKHVELFETNQLEKKAQKWPLYAPVHRLRVPAMDSALAKLIQNGISFVIPPSLRSQDQLAAFSSSAPAKPAGKANSACSAHVLLMFCSCLQCFQSRSMKQPATHQQLTSN